MIREVRICGIRFGVGVGIGVGGGCGWEVGADEGSLGAMIWFRGVCGWVGVGSFDAVVWMVEEGVYMVPLWVWIMNRIWGFCGG